MHCLAFFILADHNVLHFFFLLIIHDPIIYGFEPFIKRDRLFFTTEIAVRVTFFTVQDTIFLNRIY